MISINTDKKLNIILPNTNRALAEVLKDASPKELEVISQGKDLKSILNSLLKESSKNSSSDKTLLELVKNNPTFKELGKTNQNIKELLNTLKADSKLANIEKLLQKFLPNIKELTNENIKPNINNSGVFLESKLKDIQNPQTNLKALLTKFSDEVVRSQLPSSKTIIHGIKELLNTPSLQATSNEDLTLHVKENPKETASLAKNLQTLVTKVQLELKNADPITTLDFSNKISKLEHLLDNKNLTKENFKLSSLKDSTQQVAKVLEGSFTNQSKSSLGTIQNILQKIITIENQTSQTPSKLESNIKDLQTIVDKIKTNSKDLNNNSNKELLIKTEKLNSHINSVDINQPVTHTAIEEVMKSLHNTPIKDSNTILDALSKIFKVLKTESLEQVIDKKIPPELKAVIDNIKSSISKTDPIFSKQIRSMVNELSLLQNANKLVPDNNIKEIMSNDFKAVLNRVSDDIAKLSLPNQSEILKQVDKLLLQIDYHQLVSHLSGASSLYIPYAWEEMEDGNIQIKKASDDRFYCDIELQLKEYGELKLRLTIYDKNQLDLHIHSDNSDFKELIQENIPLLRKALIDIKITPREIRFINKPKSQLHYGDDTKSLDMGFEVKA
ncbi:flagellar hook-length control protein FliK [Sulfurimonas sp.]|nr:flagellar hook-length control protein FliK [Sulfurimonas sp.]